MIWRPQGSTAASRVAAGTNGSSGSNGSSDSGPYGCTQWVQEDLGWDIELPVGDPVSGLSWEHNGVDSGSYKLTVEGDVEPPVLSRDD
jgi:hypothetical protein